MRRNKRETRAIQPDDGTETGRYQADQCKPTNPQPDEDVHATRDNAARRPRPHRPESRS